MAAASSSSNEADEPAAPAPETPKARYPKRTRIPPKKYWMHDYTEWGVDPKLGFCVPLRHVVFDEPDHTDVADKETRARACENAVHEWARGSMIESLSAYSKKHLGRVRSKSQKKKKKKKEVVVSKTVVGKKRGRGRPSKKKSSEEDEDERKHDDDGAPGDGDEDEDEEDADDRRHPPKRQKISHGRHKKASKSKSMKSSESLKSGGPKKKRGSPNDAEQGTGKKKRNRNEYVDEDRGDEDDGGNGDDSYIEEEEVLLPPPSDDDDEAVSLPPLSNTKNSQKSAKNATKSSQKQQNNDPQSSSSPSGSLVASLVSSSSARNDDKNDSGGGRRANDQRARRGDSNGSGAATSGEVVAFEQFENSIGEAYSVKETGLVINDDKLEENQLMAKTRSMVTLTTIPQQDQADLPPAMLPQAGKSLEGSDYACGYLLLPPGVKKCAECPTSREIFYVIICEYKKLRVRIHNTYFYLSAGAFFSVPPENVYTVENLSHTDPARLTFTISRPTVYLPPEDDDDMESLVDEREELTEGGRVAEDGTARIRDDVRASPGGSDKDDDTHADAEAVHSK